MIYRFMLIVLVAGALLFGGGFESLSGQQKILKPDEAFKVSVIQKDSTIEALIKLGEKIHLYSDSLHVSVIKPQNFDLNISTKSQPHVVAGDNVYEGEVAFAIPSEQITSKVNGDYTLLIVFEGCSDSGICYLPQKKSFDFKGQSSTPAGAIEPITKPQTSASGSGENSVVDKIGSLTSEANTAKIADILKSENSFFVILLFFVFGLFLSLTPCIFPMIPILSSIIVSQSTAGKSGTARAFLTSLVYVLSMAVTYTVAGLVAGYLGADIQSAMQNPWVLILFAGLFIVLAFSLFGYYEIGLPASIQSKLTKASDSAQGKGIAGTAVMGLLSALIVGPCVAPPLGGAILFISHTGDMLLGGIALFVMSLGMGLPLLLVGIGAGKFMPKPGGWMSKVSQFFGLMMIGMAIMMLSRILPDSLSLILWAMLLIGTSLFFGLFDGKIPEGFGGYAGKLFSILFLIYGIALFVGGISGSTSVFKPFESFMARDGSVMKGMLETATKSHKGYSIERLMREVEASNKPVAVDFGKKSCAACAELEAITFPDPKVQEALKRFTFIKIDLTDNTDDDKAILEKFELFGTPNIIFFDAKHAFLAEKTLTGYVGPEAFARHLGLIAPQK